MVPADKSDSIDDSSTANAGTPRTRQQNSSRATGKGNGNTSRQSSKDDNPRGFLAVATLFALNSRRKSKKKSNVWGKRERERDRELVYLLSRELAIYSCLCLGLGGEGDSQALREEVKAAGTKVYDTALLCKSRLLPLLTSKKVKESERPELERLYRIYTGCLEALQTEFVRAMSLQAAFPLWDAANTILVNTGVSEDFINKKAYNSLEQLNASILEQKSADLDEIQALDSKARDLGELCYSMSQIMDVNPWEFQMRSLRHISTSQTTSVSVDVDTSDDGGQTPGSQSDQTDARSRRKCIWTTVLVIGALALIGGVIGLALALSKEDDEGDTTSQGPTN